MVTAEVCIKKKKLFKSNTGKKLYSILQLHLGKSQSVVSQVVIGFPDVCSLHLSFVLVKTRSPSVSFAMNLVSSWTTVFFWVFFFQRPPSLDRSAQMDKSSLPSSFGCVHMRFIICDKLSRHMKDKNKERFSINLMMIGNHGALLQLLIVGKMNELENSETAKNLFKK